MNQQKFDAALEYMMSVPPRSVAELQRDLRKLNLRIVLAEPARVPEGWALAPKEATPEMVNAVRAGTVEPQSMTHQMRIVERIKSDYAKLLSAAPQPPSSGWLPIETAPKDGTQILLGFAGDGEERASAVAQGHWQKGWGDAPDDMGFDDGFVAFDFETFRPGRSFGAESYRHSGSQPTHWMHLPPPPTEKL